MPGSLSLGSGLDPRFGYPLALLSSLLALALTAWFPGSHRDPVFMFFLLAILLTQFFAGSRPAMFAAGCSFLMLMHLAPPVLHVSRVPGPPEGFRLLNFCIAVSVILALNTRTYLVHWQTRNWKRKLGGVLPAHADMAMDMAMFEWDRKTGEMLWSERLQALRDLGPGESYEHRVASGDLARVHAELRVAIATGSAFDLRYRVLGVDGDERWLAVTGRFLMAGRFLKGPRRPRWALGTVTDVTELERAHRRLQADDERFQLAQKAALMAIWERRLGSSAIQWSPGSGAVFGFPVKDFALTLDQFLQRVHPFDRSRVQAASRRALLDEAGHEVEYRIEWPDGSQHWMLTHLHAVAGSGSQFGRMVGVTMEITSRKQAEEMLRSTERLAANGRLAATLAHEINNPLHSLRSLFYLAGQQPGLSPELRRYVELGEIELAHVTEIVRQTLGLYRQTDAVAAVSPAAEAEQVLAMCRRRIQPGRLTLEARSDFTATLAVQPGEIRQVLTNLVLNAFDAGANKIYIHIYQTRAAGTEGTAPVRIAIADNGSGIAPESMNRLFEPFFTTKGEHGTGLGLWVSRGIVEKYGGSMRVRSSTHADRHGTTFLLTFPNAEAAMASSAGPEPGPVGFRRTG